MSVAISRYKSSRHWAVYLNDELVAVTLYKKGAESVRDLLLQKEKGTK